MVSPAGVGSAVTERAATLYLEGSVSLASYAQALGDFHKLLTALSVEVGEGATVTWEIDALEMGSALTTVRATNAPDTTVADVLRAFESVGASLAAGRRPAFSSLVRQHAEGLVRLLDDGIQSLRLETEREEYVVSAHLAPEGAIIEVPGPTVAYGAVEGRIQTLSNRGSLRFTLYDTLEDRAVSCYLSQGQEDSLRGLWGRRAIVQGSIRRDATGRPLTIRRITGVSLLPEQRTNAWQGARGAVRRPAEAPLAEVAIRRLRDAQ